ncbi:MAG: Omp28 family outer membrane lipoprotein [Bacteroidaceae bacterium]|nr:Omp28 family outer membrane lipoprotein [Bacteroidaceae bacterium]
MKNQLIPYILGILCLSSCSNVDLEDRLIYVEPPVVVPPPDTPDDDVVFIKPCVLIEDFTGQRCVNCPNASKEIENLKSQYGEDMIVAVGIHSGPLAVFPTAKVVGLRTETGDAYYQYWNIEAEPTGYINRTGTISTMDLWQTQVRAALQRTANVRLAAKNTYDADTRTLTIQVEAYGREAVTGKLQVWLTESNIVAMQMMPDGTLNRDYVHNHVFRTAVNGTWGDDFALSKDETKTVSFTVPIDEAWKPADISTVAFLYNDNGVLQVTESPL